MFRLASFSKRNFSLAQKIIPCQKILILACPVLSVNAKNIFTDHLEMANSADAKIVSLELEDSAESKKARFQLVADSPKTEIVLTFNYVGVHYSW